MPAIQVNQRILITLCGSYFRQRTMTTFPMRVNAAPTEPNDVTFFNALHTLITGPTQFAYKYQACTPDDGQWVPTEIWYQVIAPNRFRKVVRPWDLAAQYSAVSSTANVSAAIERNGDLAGRKNVGGIRVPIATNGAENGLLKDDLVDALEELAGSMLLLLSTVTPAVTLVPQIGLPGYHGEPPIPGNPMDSVDLTGTVAKEEARVMRRRTVGQGI